MLKVMKGCAWVVNEEAERESVMKRLGMSETDWVDISDNYIENDEIPGLVYFRMDLIVVKC